MLRKLYNDEFGFVVSAEYMLIITLAFCAAAVGWSAVRDALVNELNDVATAIGAVDQSYNYVGFKKVKASGNHATCAGSGYNDQQDDCDCKKIEYIEVCGKTDPSASGKHEDGTI